MQKNELIKMQIIDITEEGNGVAKVDGFAVFIPHTAIGDQVLVRIVKVLKSYAYGKVEQMLTPSKDRIDPDCACFSRCGGCTFRHLRYESELFCKQKWVEDHLRRLGGIDITPEPILTTGKVDGYRNKAQYPVQMIDGKVRAGFFAKRSHRLIPCEDCKLQPDFFSDILTEVCDFLSQENISIYEEGAHRGSVRHIYLRYAQKTGEIMVCLVLNGEHLPKEKMLIKRLTEKFPAIKSIVINKNQEKTNVILGKKCRTIFGTDTITDELCGVKIKISPLSFYQVNRDAAEMLYHLAADYAGLTGKETLLDLYCGTGTIGLSMAHRVKKLIGVEIVEDAVRDARENAKINGITNASFTCEDAASCAARFAREGIKPDVVIVDPPRKGCALQVIESIVQMQPERVVMISCNSATAARDCKVFSQMGYQVVKARPADLFPRTGHVECVILLTRKNKDEVNNIQTNAELQ